MNGKKNQFNARLDNQKAQLERHGNFAEVVIRTTREGTDMINFARMWEHVLVTADRSTRGYVSQAKREDFEKTRQDFVESIDFMIEKLQKAVDRHNLDMAGNNFISRIAQRYGIAERKRSSKPEGEKEEAPKKAKASAAKKEAAAAPAEEVQGIDSDNLEAEEVQEKPKKAAPRRASTATSTGVLSDEVESL